MKVLLINGSPHQKGCTYTALSEVAEALHNEGIETDIYWIGNKPIGGCIGCFQCAKKQKCVFEDKVNEFTALSVGYDGFIFGSPVYCHIPRAMFELEKNADKNEEIFETPGELRARIGDLAFEVTQNAATERAFTVVL